ncbi:MAG: IS1634 family transposase [Legionellaceae bacterium]|nr:IS1634 family transposase [Legionellaceae bacterium]
MRKSLKYHQIHYDVIPIWKYAGRGRPSAGATKNCAGYRIEACLASDLDKINQHRQSLGRFLLATNQLDTVILSDADILKQYKEQSSVEAGFKFIKNDSFELDSFYLKTPARIGALMMVMTLCLMVYNFAQYQIWQSCHQKIFTFPTWKLICLIRFKVYGGSTFGNLVRNPTATEYRI